jgi:hypothetical protein
MISSWLASWTACRESPAFVRESREVLLSHRVRRRSAAIAAHRECARDDHALVLMNTNNGACYVASLRGDRRAIERVIRGGSPILRLTLELVTVGDFALPVAGLFVQVKGQSAGARDLLQAGPCTPAGAGTEKKKGACVSLSGKRKT